MCEHAVRSVGEVSEGVCEMSSVSKSEILFEIVSE